MFLIVALFIIIMGMAVDEPPMCYVVGTYIIFTDQIRSYYIVKFISEDSRKDYYLIRKYQSYNTSKSNTFINISIIF